MNGSMRLTEDEKQELRRDAQDPGRRAAFAAARRLSHEGSLEDYLDFLSENMASCRDFSPRRRITDNYRL
jgi:hypothetical protein